MSYTPSSVEQCLEEGQLQTYRGKHTIVSLA